jgi:hypothetical protein
MCSLGPGGSLVFHVSPLVFLVPHNLVWRAVRRVFRAHSDCAPENTVLLACVCCDLEADRVSAEGCFVKTNGFKLYTFRRLAK